MKRQILSVLKTGIISLLLNLLIISCNNGESGSNACSLGFVRDYKSIVNGLGLVRTKNDLISIRTLAEQFKAKYAGVVCQADDPDPPGQLEPQRITIDATAKMNEMIAKIDEALAHVIFPN